MHTMPINTATVQSQVAFYCIMTLVLGIASVMQFILRADKDAVLLARL